MLTLDEAVTQFLHPSNERTREIALEMVGEALKDPHVLAAALELTDMALRMGSGLAQGTHSAMAAGIAIGRLMERRELT